MGLFCKRNRSTLSIVIPQALIFVCVACAQAADRTEAALDSRKSDLDAREAKLKKLEKLAGLSH